MPFSINGKNLLLNALPNLMMVSLHYDDPGETGANELSGGNPPYGRPSVILNLASNGVRTSATGSVVAPVPPNVPVKWVGWWTTGGVFISSCEVEEFLHDYQSEYSLSLESFTIV